MKDEGGGASRSTDPAAGSSAATDVSLREYLGAQIANLDHHLTAEINSLRRETTLANANSEKAISLAADEANERLKAHNGLIEQMRQQAEASERAAATLANSFARQETFSEFKDANDKRIQDLMKANDLRVGRIERFQAMLAGGLILASFIGVANIIKVWTG